MSEILERLFVYIAFESTMHQIYSRKSSKNLCPLVVCIPLMCQISQSRECWSAHLLHFEGVPSLSIMYRSFRQAHFFIPSCYTQLTSKWNLHNKISTTQLLDRIPHVAVSGVRHTHSNTMYVIISFTSILPKTHQRQRFYIFVQSGQGHISL